MIKIDAAQILHVLEQLTFSLTDTPGMCAGSPPFF